jgi:hypothetical protein
MANGKPTSVWTIRCTDADLDSCVDVVTQTGGKETKWKLVKRCAFCMRGPPFADFHDHTQCPLVGTMNKIREQGGFSIIKVEGGALNLELVKSSDDTERKIKALETRVVELEKRVSKLEPKTAKKRAASDADKSPPAKKKKTDANTTTAGPSKTKKKSTK